MRPLLDLGTTCNMVALLGFSACCLSTPVWASSVNVVSTDPTLPPSAVATADANFLNRPLSELAEQQQSKNTATFQRADSLVIARAAGANTVENQSDSMALEQDPNTEQDNNVMDAEPRFSTSNGFDLPNDELQEPDSFEQYNLFYRDPNIKNINYLTQQAKAGDTSAQVQLAFAYARGQEVQQDFTEAFKWFKLAADQGDPLAMAYVGTMYLKGDGVEQDYTQAHEWLNKAASQDDPQACYALGLLYYEGKGVAQDMAAAFQWFNKAALRDHADAQFKLAEMYEKGEYLAQDLKQSLEWYESACLLGADEACAKAAQLQPENTSNTSPEDQMILQELEQSHNEPDDPESQGETGDEPLPNSQEGVESPVSSASEATTNSLIDSTSEPTTDTNSESTTESDGTSKIDPAVEESDSLNLDPTSNVSDVKESSDSLGNTDTLGNTNSTESTAIVPSAENETASTLAAPTAHTAPAEVSAELSAEVPVNGETVEILEMPESSATTDHSATSVELEANSPN